MNCSIKTSSLGYCSKCRYCYHALDGIVLLKWG